MAVFETSSAVGLSLNEVVRYAIQWDSFFCIDRNHRLVNPEFEVVFWDDLCVCDTWTCIIDVSVEWLHYSWLFAREPWILLYQIWNLFSHCIIIFCVPEAVVLSSVSHATSIPVTSLTSHITSLSCFSDSDNVAEFLLLSFLNVSVFVCLLTRTPGWGQDHTLKVRNAGL